MTPIGKTPPSLQEQLYDIYGMYHVPFWQTNVFYWSVIFLLALFILGTGWYFFARWRKRKQIKMAWDRALDQLQALKSSSKFQTAYAREFYQALTTIIKEYMQHRFEQPLTSMTDDECLQVLEHLELPHDIRHGMRDIFDGVVFIKFAHAQGTLDRMKRDIAVATILVRRTMPQQNTIDDKR
jgi:hypothetical protein